MNTLTFCTYFYLFDIFLSETMSKSEISGHLPSKSSGCFYGNHKSVKMRAVPICYKSWNSTEIDTCPVSFLMITMIIGICLPEADEYAENYFGGICSKEEIFCLKYFPFVCRKESLERRTGDHMYVAGRLSVL